MALMQKNFAYFTGANVRGQHFCDAKAAAARPRNSRTRAYTGSDEANGPRMRFRYVGAADEIGEVDRSEKLRATD
ncbi:hypothetical protein [Trinickia fusca]|uniref:Uncharacterized protein n=1 Tax=Trinickia fusca TaxID=2419777 RepID=A0A494XJK4_9BURK|nr:hypothetical protein [Trinickia fusca]RKP50758.1 hypothetical protein D7S89_06680 [Trinickia fusca]